MKLLNPQLTRAFTASAVKLHGQPAANLTAITQSEKEHFQQLAATWWDSQGPQRILHKMNLLRMDFIVDNIRDHIKVNAGKVDEEEKVFIPGWSHENLLPKELSAQISSELNAATWEKYTEMKMQCLDIGCGGGLLSESLARLPNVVSVKGIDMTPEVIAVANEHKQLDPILAEKLEYELTSLDDIPAENMYDVVTCMEMLEHVEHPAVVLKKALSHVKPGGYFFLSTINRDFVSWFTTIFMGEHVLKIVPLGTHTFSKYIKEEEMQDFISKMNEFEVIDSKGCAYLPAVGWFYMPTAKVGNYLMAFKRK